MEKLKKCDKFTFVVCEHLIYSALRTIHNRVTFLTKLKKASIILYVLIDKLVQVC